MAPAHTTADFEIAYHAATPHGVLTAVVIPDAPDPVPEEVLERLHPDEAAHAVTLRGYTQVQFCGGRLALRAACGQLGVDPPGILSNDRGAPVVPAGIAASISHKGTLAIGMAARDVDGTLGADLENYGPPRPRIAERILRPEELAAIEDLSPERRWIAVLLRFSIKESIYKALDPYVRRYVGFHEANVTPDLRGSAEVTLHLANSEGPYEVDARYEWMHGRILTSARILPAPRRQ